MFQLYSHHRAYLLSLVELHMLNAYCMWDPSSEARIFTGGIKNNFMFLIPVHIIVLDCIPLYQ
jgi:hypothetical protein